MIMEPQIAAGYHNVTCGKDKVIFRTCSTVLEAA